MKKIKVLFCGDDVNNKFSFAYYFFSILKKYYEVELSDNPDYVFYNDSSYEHLKYDCIKIFYTGENIHPNFNFCDYAISFDYLDFADRHYRLPLYLVTIFYNQKEIEHAGDTDFITPIIITKKDLEKKTEFCSFVYSNYLADETRKIFFNKLNQYKKVNAGGKYLNNIGKRIKNKLEFETTHKFSIAFENSSRSGYTTEKIVNSLAAKTIPIYFGNPDIHKEFNEKRFINCHRYSNFDEVIEKIKEIDNNDDLYLSTVNQPATIPEYNFKETRENFETFLRHIMDQPLDSAKRIKINPAKLAGLIKNERKISELTKSVARRKKWLALIYQPFKKIKFLEDVKHRYFHNKLLNK